MLVNFRKAVFNSFLLLSLLLNLLLPTLGPLLTHLIVAPHILNLLSTVTINLLLPLLIELELTDSVDLLQGLPDLLTFLGRPAPLSSCLLASLLLLLYLFFGILIF